MNLKKRRGTEKETLKLCEENLFAAVCAAELRNVSERRTRNKGGGQCLDCGRQNLNQHLKTNKGACCGSAIHVWRP